MQNDDETYCDDFATFNQTGDESFENQESPANASIVSSQDSVQIAMAQIKIEKPSPPSTRSYTKKSPSGLTVDKSETRPKNEPNTASTSTVIILEEAINEIITLEDTQSTWSSFENILGDQNDTEKSFLSRPPKKLGAYKPDDKTPELKSVQSRTSDDVSCADCDKVYR